MPQILRDFSKRILDLAGAFVLFVAMSPIMFAIFAVGIFIFPKGPLFSQIRPGYKGNLFRLYKFKTMCDAYDKSGNLLDDSERMTKWGLFLRRTSLDELPELWNVLKGDLSLVGPRPLLVEYLPRYSEEEMRRHDVKPGLTGWAQVNGRNALTWKEKFDLDLWYVDHRSLVLDLKILFLTVAIVLGRKDIQAEGHVSMPKFEGHDSKRKVNS